jgi:mRNA-degrading endonuclease toxin of MazEF toxin-antitoxin module
MIEKYSIWLADVPFKEISGNKIRPVLILDEHETEVLCFKMTSRPRSVKSDYEILHWEAAGLNVRTTVVAQRISLEKHRLKKQIGSLHPDDIALLRLRLQQV